MEFFTGDAIEKLSEKSLDELEDLVGETFGGITILKIYQKYETEYFATCQCSCGRIMHGRLELVLSGRRPYCGHSFVLGK